MITLFLILILNFTLIAPAGERRLFISAGEILFDKNELSWYSIDYWIQFYGIREPEKVKRQIKHETAHLTSRICKQDNNLFGMKYPQKRKTVAIGRDKSMAVYKTWQDSILDYAIWQGCFYSEGDYYEFLKSHGYATDTRYIEKLKRLN